MPTDFWLYRGEAKPKKQKPGGLNADIDYYEKQEHTSEGSGIRWPT